MNQLNLKQTVSIIKECEDLKIRIDSLIDMGNKLSNASLNDFFEFKLEKPFVKKEVIEMDVDDDATNNSLRGLWSLQFTSGNIIKETPKDYFTENLSVQESLVLINHLLFINRDRLKQKVSILNELGISIAS